MSSKRWGLGYIARSFLQAVHQLDSIKMLRHVARREGGVECGEDMHHRPGRAWVSCYLKVTYVSFRATRRIGSHAHVVHRLHEQAEEVHLRDIGVTEMGQLH